MDFDFNIFTNLMTMSPERAMKYRDECHKKTISQVKEIKIEKKEEIIALKLQVSFSHYCLVNTAISIPPAKPSKAPETTTIIIPSIMESITITLVFVE